MGAPAGDLSDRCEIVVEIGSLAAHAKVGRFFCESLGFRLVEFASPRLSKGRQDQESTRPGRLRDSSDDSRAEDVFTVDGRPPSPSERADSDRPAVLLHLNER
jgi:hypothetical protein